MGEHLPCKQGVESSNLLVSIGIPVDSTVILMYYGKENLYLENRILKTLSIKESIQSGREKPEAEDAPRR